MFSFHNVARLSLSVVYAITRHGFMFIPIFEKKRRERALRKLYSMFLNRLSTVSNCYPATAVSLRTMYQTSVSSFFIFQHMLVSVRRLHTCVPVNALKHSASMSGRVRPRASIKRYRLPLTCAAERERESIPSKIINNLHADTVSVFKNGRRLDQQEVKVEQSEPSEHGDVGPIPRVEVASRGQLAAQERCRN